MHCVAYNYHWDLEYIKTSFDDSYIKKLLDDALIFNPWVSKHKSEEIPQDIIQQIAESRKKWEQEKNAAIDDARSDN